ncbi:ATP-binding protein [Candidatus Roizmanbacteria bacterium CG_4_10_14_0_2_um_filter_39_13]|uniref:ATP-binding protein n=1 Tax=Candidatus Roizmanbacteria bacterium CG_4_10_14_0_2_um_filter_39_13 TaxID=1974825 RepID=A0A2M7TWD9_9BACT|nr:MAG: ATP-binding protein [Candidatus Roizmanbacteria bacterium CG_4_10_14_0_2_um_filter_39_13]
MKKQKSTLHLICGLPGTGKTTLSKKIEKETGAVRMCPDEWIKEIWANDAETTGNTYRDKIEQLQWKLGKEILKSGTDIIIEWGTWGKDERDRLRNEAKTLGSHVKPYYLHAEKEVLKAHILERNKNLGKYEFLMPENTLDEELDKAIATFEVPTEEELEEYDK